MFSYIELIIWNDCSYKLESISSWYFVFVQYIAILNDVCHLDRLVLYYTRELDTQLWVVIQLRLEDIELLSYYSGRQTPGAISVTEKCLKRQSRII